MIIAYKADKMIGDMWIAKHNDFDCLLAIDTSKERAIRKLKRQLCELGVIDERMIK